MIHKKPFINICGKDISVQGRLIRIARIDGEKFTFPGDPELMVEGLRRSGVRADLFTFLQKLPETTPKYGYPMEWDNLAVLPVSTYDHWWTHQIRSYARNRARQASKRGVLLREVPFDRNLLEGICNIYNECPVRQGRRFPHYGMTLESAQRYAGTFLGRSIFLGAFFEGKMIGFVKLVMDETRTHACAIHILSMIQHRDKAPTNALVAQAVRTCAERGISYLVYEKFTYGRKSGDSLSAFKEANGFERMELPRYYIPVTKLGAIALRLSLHHRFVDRIPEPILAKLRELRTAWHMRKLEPSAHTS
jgi:hypothetical protein